MAASRGLRSQDIVYDVFLSHAGEQKNHASLIYETLDVVKWHSGSDFTAFLDASSLRPGYPGWDKIIEAAEQSCIGVFIITPEFVRKVACLDEVEIFNERCRNNGKDSKPLLLPVFLGLSWDACQTLELAYETEPWLAGNEKPGVEILKVWASRMRELCKFSGRNREQAGMLDGRVVFSVVDDILQLLKDKHKLHTAYQRKSSECEGVFLSSMKKLPGRGQEVPIQPGDSLRGIATRHGSNVDAILLANPHVRDALRAGVGSIYVPSTPAPSALAPRPTHGSAMLTHQSVPGDTLSTLALIYNTSLSSLLEANPHIADPNIIQPGATICVPGPTHSFIPPHATSKRTYIVKQCDTLYAIAAQHGILLHTLLAANRSLDTGAAIYAGQAVSIPLPSCNPGAAPYVRSFNASAPSGGTTRRYAVKKGDFLSAIAAKHGLTLKVLLEANPEITNPGFINLGDIINLPP